jgi:hypothetical protein
MTIHRIQNVSSYEERLKTHFDKLMSELVGKRITAQQAKSRYFDVRENETDAEFYDINHLDLRLAIEAFTAILKETKKFASKP